MNFFLGIIIVFLFLGCGGKTKEAAPSNLIPKKEFIALLIDLEIMEAYYEQVHKRPNIYKTTLDSASKRILANRSITEDQLKSTLNYYSAKPDSLFLVFEVALDSLNSLVIKNKTKLDE